MTKSSGFFLATITVALGLALALSIFANDSPVHAQPLPSHIFVGKVTVGGSPAQANLNIEARINNVNYAQSTALGAGTVTESDGTYGQARHFSVCADSPFTTETEGGVNGDTILFYVNRILATTSLVPATFRSGDATELDLSISSLSGTQVTATGNPFACKIGDEPPTPTPTSTPPPPAVVPPGGFFPVRGLVAPVPTITPTPLPTAEDIALLALGDAVSTLEALEIETAVDLVGELDIALAANIFDLLGLDLAAGILGGMNVGSAADVIALVDVIQAAGMIVGVPPGVAADIFEDTNILSAAAITEEVAPDAAADIYDNVATISASNILGEVSPPQAGAIFERMLTDNVEAIVDVMAEIKLVLLLVEMSPQGLHRLDPEVLFSNLPSVSDEHLISEVLPFVDPSLADAVFVQVSATEFVYEREEGGPSWTSIVSSPAPLDLILADFARPVSNI